MAKPRYVAPIVKDTRFPTALMAEQDRVAVGGDEEWQALDFEERSPLAELDLGGTRIRILGEEPELRAALERKWGAFLCPPGGGAHVTVSLRGVARLPFEAPVAVVASARRGRQLLAKLRGLAIRLDPDSGRSACLVERSRPLQDLGNLLRTLLTAFSWRQGAWLVRAAAVEVGGRAVLLAGSAHAGKSTAARLAVPRVVMSDDAVALALADAGGGVVARGVGLWGIEGSAGLETPRRRSAHGVAGVFLLEKTGANRATAVSRARAALEMVASLLVLPGERETSRLALAFAEALAERLPVWRLEFHNRDGSLWEVVERSVAGL